MCYHSFTAVLLHSTTHPASRSASASKLNQQSAILEARSSRWTHRSEAECLDWCVWVGISVCWIVSFQFVVHLSMLAIWCRTHLQEHARMCNHFIYGDRNVWISMEDITAVLLHSTTHPALRSASASKLNQQSAIIEARSSRWTHRSETECLDWCGSSN